ncbi:hypothetical protein F5Y17DRAFT_463545 [Xylariaceae sp. FL0594]|nr:hypothetical protein F5Y17DRAFT_463545 [Xylariaceae sp. FL0594]
MAGTCSAPSGGAEESKIEIIVGETETRYLIDMAKIGPLWKLVMREEPSVIRLRRYEPDIFQMVADWTEGLPFPRVCKALIPDSPYDFVANPTQTRLLRVMLFAEDFEWEALYNDAIDAYRWGEVELDIWSPHREHIEMAYEHSFWWVRTFMAEYIYGMGKKNGDLSEYASDDFYRIPNFIADVLDRVDGKCLFIYPTPANGGRGVLEKDEPLNLHKASYHVHNGQDMVSCNEVYCKGWK